MSQFFTFRDADGVVREAEAYIIQDYSNTNEPDKPIKTNSNGLINPELIDPRIVKNSSVSFVLTSSDITSKKVTLPLESLYNSFIVIPEGALPQRNGIDFIYVESDNSISWAGLGLDGFLEIDEILEITYFHR